MNFLTNISRLVVGSLFIVSGLIKANDPVGFSYKLKDYFAPDVLNLEFLVPLVLPMAVLICAVEIVLGVAALFGSVFFVLAKKPMLPERGTAPDKKA